MGMHSGVLAADASWPALLGALDRLAPAFEERGPAADLSRAERREEDGYALDLGGTASVGTADSAPTSAGNSTFDIPAPGYGQGIWGSR